MTLREKGFTIVELLIVIVVIGILAAIVIVAFNGVQNRARTAKLQSDIQQVHKQVQAYHALNGEYPKTTDTTIAGSSTSAETYSEPGCSYGTARADWIPGIDAALPKSDFNTGKGAAGRNGCFMYQSDGRSYILSAWNLLSAPQDGTGYRRIGFREMVGTNTMFYYCNQVNIGGNNPTPYDASRDYYKHSVTFTNITFCNETPPAGA